MLLLLRANAQCLPTILAPPTPSDLCVTAEAPAGTGALHYQWYFNGTLVPGETGACFGATTAPAVAGAYHVSVENLCGIVLSGPVYFPGLPPDNTPPVANNLSVMGIEDTDILGTVTGSDADGPATLTFSLASVPANGSVVVNLDGLFTYTPNMDFAGADSFTFAVSDGLASAVATVSITVLPVNDPPVADNLSVTGNENTAIPGTVTGSDVDGPAALTFSLASGPLNGSVVLNPDHSFTYTPNTDFTGSDSFTFRASDGLLLSPIATVSITVTPSATGNHPPVAVINVSADADLDGGDPEVIVISVNGVDAPVTLYGTMSSDPDGDPLMHSWDSGAIVGEPIVSTRFALGTHPVSLEVSDGRGGFDAAVVSVRVIPVREAIGHLIAQVQTSAIRRLTKVALVLQLSVGIERFDRSRCEFGLETLRNFKTSVSIATSDRWEATTLVTDSLAAEWNYLADEIINNVMCE